MLNLQLLISNRRFIIFIFLGILGPWLTDAFLKRKAWRCMISFSDSTNDQNEIVRTRRIFLGNLTFAADEKAIGELIDSTIGSGLTESIQIAYGKKSKDPRGFAFVNFLDYASAELAAEKLNGVAFQNRIINCNLKEDNVQIVDPTATKVYLSNLDYSLTLNEVRDMCDDILGVGVVRSIKYPMSADTGMPLGHAYVEFKKAETVQKAITEFNSLEVLGRMLRCQRLKTPAELKQQTDSV